MLTDLIPIQPVVAALDTNVLTALAVAAGIATGITVTVDYLFRSRRTKALIEATNRATASAEKLRQVVASATDLSGARLAGLDLTRIQLREGQLRGADLSRAILREADLADADCSRAILRSADLVAASCRATNFTEADLGMARLASADLSRAILVNCNLRDADLRGARLSSADLTGALLAGADLRGANLDGATTQGADLTDARLPEGFDAGHQPRAIEGTPDMRPILPLYVVVDSSGSMAGGPIEAVMAQLDSLLLSERQRPNPYDLALSVITFSDSAEVALPLTSVDEAVIPATVRANGGTAYGPAFALLAAQLRQELGQVAKTGRRYFRPIVWFISDGTPTDPPHQWEAELRGVLDAPAKPTLMAVGIGSVDAETINRLGANAAFLAEGASLVEAIRNIGVALGSTVSSAGLDGRVQVPAIPGFANLVTRRDL